MLACHQYTSISLFDPISRTFISDPIVRITSPVGSKLFGYLVILSLQIVSDSKVFLNFFYVYSSLKIFTMLTGSHAAELGCYCPSVGMLCFYKLGRHKSQVYVAMCTIGSAWCSGRVVYGPISCYMCHLSIRCNTVHFFLMLGVSYFTYMARHSKECICRGSSMSKMYILVSILFGNCGWF